MTDERDVEARLTRRVRGAGGMCVKLLPDFLKGIPDRMVLLPGGHVLFVELKVPTGGVVSDIQKMRHAKLRSLGFDVRVMRTPEEIDSASAEWYSYIK